MYYKAIIECGHMGAGKSVDTVRYFRAENPADLFSAAARIPRAKGKALGTSVKLVEKISWEEYEKGLEKSRTNPYLRTRKGKPGRKRAIPMDAVKASTPLDALTFAQDRQSYAPRQSSGQAEGARW